MMNPLLKIKNGLLALRKEPGLNCNHLNRIDRILEDITAADLTARQAVVRTDNGEPDSIINAGDMGSLEAAIRVAERTNKSIGRNKLQVRRAVILLGREVTDHNLNEINRSFKRQ